MAAMPLDPSTQPLRQDGEFALYRGSGADGAAILILSPVSEHPAPATLARLDREYALRDELAPAWAARPRARGQVDGRPALILDDPGGEPLDTCLGGALATAPFLDLAIAIADALAGLHARGLVHRDLRPGHILVDREGGARLTGFGLAAPGPCAPTAAGGDSLPYLAPEQTGRLNRPVDSRADLYALGVVFYRMLTGELPFAAADAAGWIHCHLARCPPAPAERQPAIPAPLSDLVMKLLAKSADERYQTAAGVAADLRRCRDAWRRHGRIPAFALGRRDLPERLTIPDRLYGRRREIAALLAAHRRAAAGTPELVLLSGPAGIGKSALAEALRRQLPAEGAFFAAGKFDQYRHDLPYAPLAQALRGLVRQLLVKEEAEIAAWREALRAALGASQGLLAELVPELAQVAGPPPPLPPAEPGTAENRFLAALARFIGVFARPGQALLLFLDDLQWLDAGTLALLRHLLTRADIPHLLVIGACRDDEVGPGHPLRGILQAARDAGTRCREIALPPLAAADLTRLLGDALHCRPARAAPLAQLVHARSGGNPFFALQFLAALPDEGLLRFDREAAAWTWDLELIRGKGYTDNVADLLLAKLGRLAPAARALLARLACLGGHADTAVLALADGRTVGEIEAGLQPAVAAGFLLCREGSCKFSHDRVYEAAYALVPPARRTAEHLAIGRRLLAGLPAGDGEPLFAVVGQLNRGAALMTDPAERQWLAGLNARAGRRAKAAVAYAAAADYLGRAVAGLPAAAWDADYAEVFARHLEYAECAHLAGRFAAAGEGFAKALAHARDDGDRARICRLRSRLCQSMGQFDAAMRLAVEALQLLGLTPPADDAGLLAAADRLLDELRTELPVPAIAGLAALPVAADALAALRIGVLVDALSCAYASRPPYFPWLAAQAVIHSRRDGNTADSCAAYTSYAIVLIAFRRDLEAAFAYSQAALALLDRFPDPHACGSVLAGHGGLVLPWRRHIAEGIPYLERGLAALLAGGDFLTAGYLLMLPLWATLEKGAPLQQVIEAGERYAALARQIHNPPAGDTVRLCARLAASLRGETSPPASLDGPGFSEAGVARRFRRTGWQAGLAYFQVMKLIAAYLYGDYRGALAAADRAAPVLGQMMAMPVAASMRFYQLLALAALLPEQAPAKRRQSAARLAAGLEELASWAASCPANFAHRHALVAAEAARLDGRATDAERLYEQAIAAARNNGFVHHEALANELAGRFHLARGFPTIAGAYLRQARDAYRRWGATGKLQDLDRRFPDLGALPAGGVEQLDLPAAMRAAQAVSGEIEVAALVETLLRIACEHAGAERALLARPQGDGFRVDALALAGRDRIEAAPAEAAAAAEVPESILRYVLRTREQVLLDDAAAPNLFADDAYLQRQRPRSILCLPLLKQARLVAVLYLENRLAAGVFTPGRVALLEFLAAQAAASLENARLYSALRQENSERKEAEAALAESRARLAAILGSALDAIITVDAGQRIVLFNAAAERMFGWLADDVLGEPLDRLIPERFRSRHREHVRRFAESGTTQRLHGGAIEVLGLRADGQEFPIDAAISGAEAGGQKLYTVMLRDSSERKRSESERQARLAAELASRAKSTFLASMSHELRTPLNAILGYAQILRRSPGLGERQAAALDTIRQSGEHLLALIDDILDLSRIEAGRIEIFPEAVELRAFLRLVADIARVRAQAKGLEFVFETDPDLPAGVRVDQQRLRQILLNLLGNAVKFTDRGQVRLRVLALPGGDAATARLRFEVEDSGPGIAAGDQEAIFQPFEQVGDVRQRRGGTGLGLTISRELARRLGSEIRLESAPGAGSRFWFDLALPLAAAAAAPGREERAITGYRGRRRRILVVDDVAANRDMLVSLLGLLGFEVAAAGSGAAGLRAVEAAPPDLVVMDMSMPGMDGHEAMRRIRALPGRERLPIVAVSASAGPEDRNRSLAAGASSFIGKPIDQACLLSHIGSLLGLEWSREAPAAAGDTPLLAPPRAEMETLHHLAQTGNMRDILRQADHLAALDARYRPFAERLRELARGYQSKAILALVAAGLEAPAEDDGRA